MIDPVLKKFGLFQARKSVKSLNNTLTQSTKTPKKVIINSQRQLSQSTIKTPRQAVPSLPMPIPTPERYSPSNKLQSIRNLLLANYSKNCQVQSHQNKIKFICLNEQCRQHFGCAQCFLYKHADHQKAEIAGCIRQVEELQSLMKDYYQLIITQKSVLRAQFASQIQLQVNNMIEEFQSSLHFLKNKALKQIDDNLFAKYEEIQILNRLRMQDSKKMTQSQIITELMRLDIKGIEHSLQKQLKQLSYQKLCYQPIIKTFQQMNGALCNFIGEFKKCFPKIYKYRINQSTKYGQSSQIKPSGKFNTIAGVKQYDGYSYSGEIGGRLGTESR